MSNSSNVDHNRMPKVDFVKDQVHPYLIDQVKVAEKANLKRVAFWKWQLFACRRSMAFLSSVVIGIYAYTMYAVKSETFLDNFDDPSLEEDL